MDERSFWGRDVEGRKRVLSEWRLCVVCGQSPDLHPHGYGLGGNVCRGHYRVRAWRKPNEDSPDEVVAARRQWLADFRLMTEFAAAIEKPRGSLTGPMPLDLNANLRSSGPGKAAC
jgi:hypothetical protein